LWGVLRHGGLAYESLFCLCVFEDMNPAVVFCVARKDGKKVKKKIGKKIGKRRKKGKKFFNKENERSKKR